MSRYGLTVAIGVKAGEHQTHKRICLGSADLLEDRQKQEIDRLQSRVRELEQKVASFERFQRYRTTSNAGIQIRERNAAAKEEKLRNQDLALQDKEEELQEKEQELQEKEMVLQEKEMVLRDLEKKVIEQNLAACSKEKRNADTAAQLVEKDDALSKREANNLRREGELEKKSRELAEKEAFLHNSAVIENPKQRLWYIAQICNEAMAHIQEQPPSAPIQEQPPSAPIQ